MSQEQVPFRKEKQKKTLASDKLACSLMYNNFVIRSPGFTQLVPVLLAVLISFLFAWFQLSLEWKYSSHNVQV